MSTDFQKRIGYVDVKSSPVHFYVQREKSFKTKHTPIPFDVERLNVGGPMNLKSGVFTAPRDGIYSFSFTGLVNLPASTSRAHLHVVKISSNRIISTSVGRPALDSHASVWSREILLSIRRKICIC